jgi:hypothetical protein
MDKIDEVLKRNGLDPKHIESVSPYWYTAIRICMTQYAGEQVKNLSVDTVKPVKDCSLMYAHNKMRQQNYNYCSHCGKKL